MISPGKVVYHLYHRPLEVLRKTFKTGLRKTAATNAGRRQMAAAALQLKERVYPGAERYEVYFLTGKKYWFQTAFCLYSLQQQAGVNIHAVVLDDGSFDAELTAQVLAQFPTTVTIIRRQEIENLLNEKLPESRFPVLRQRRIVYPHLRKLTDVHLLPGDGPKLVLDSDMLFFQPPAALLQWLRQPGHLLFMTDCEESYGYSRPLMQKLTGGAAIPERLNVGVAGVPSAAICWEELEHWTATLLREEGSSYLQEQALTAMIAARHPYRLLNEARYKVLPTIRGTAVPEVLHHYVAEAKYDYFVKGWKFFV